MVAPVVKFVNGETRRACASCATAKTKCVTSSSGSGSGSGINSSCDRCLLLKKTCTSRPENNKKRKRRTAQAVLAEKVDEIVALLKVSPNQPERSEGGQHITIPERPAVHTATPSALCFPSSIDSHGLTVDVAEADNLLAHFRQHQAALAPYVEIPKAITASQLREEKPLVFLAVMTAASQHDAQRQEAFCKASIDLLADLVLIQGQKNLALLQGMMLLLGYFHTQNLVNPQITNLLHLCMAMSVDLGLNQAPAPAPDPRRGPTILDGQRTAFQVPGANVQRRTLEERRAYAGCFYLSTVVATSFIITVSTALPWSAQLDEACDVLSQTGINGDLRLARLVKLQHITSQISEVKEGIMSSGHGAFTPLSIYISPFEATLTKLWDDTPEDVRQDPCLHLAYHTARMHLYQISLPPTTPSPSSCHHLSPTPIPIAISISSARTLCLSSALAGLEVHLSVAPAKLYHMPLPFYAMTGRVLTTLARLRGCASSTDKDDPLRFDLAGVLERAAEHLESAPPVGSGGSGSDAARGKGRNDRLSHWAAWLRRCARALGIAAADGSSGGRGGDIRGFVAAMEPSLKQGVVELMEEEEEENAAGRDERELDGALAQDVAAGGYMTPSSGLDMGGVPEDGAGDMVLPQEGDSFPMEWTAALLEDLSGYGMFGLSDDFLMQDMFASGSGGDVGRLPGTGD